MQYTHEDSPIARWQITYDTINDRVIMRTENLDYTKTFSATLGLPLKVSDWWRAQNNLIYTSQDIREYNSNDKANNLSINIFSINSTSSFKLSDSFTAEITAFYRGPSYSGSAKNNEFYRADIGIQKKFGDKWGSLRFAANDVFDSSEWKSVTDVPDQNLTIARNFKFSHRTFSLTYSRSFGNSKVKSSRNRETGSEEERRRVNN